MFLINIVSSLPPPLRFAIVPGERVSHNVRTAFNTAGVLFLELGCVHWTGLHCLGLDITPLVIVENYDLSTEYNSEV